MFEFRFVFESDEVVRIIRTDKQHLLLKNSANNLVDAECVTFIDGNADCVDETYGEDFCVNGFPTYDSTDTVLVGLYDDNDVKADVLELFQRSKAHCIFYGDNTEGIPMCLEDVCLIVTNLEEQSEVEE